MNYQAAPMYPSNSGSVVVPPGWKAEWSAQYSAYFYINLSTNESTWALPAAPQQQQQMPQQIARKPVPIQSPQLQSQAPAPMGNQVYHGYPTPPPQATTGYFPPASNFQQQQQQQQQYSQSLVSPLQQQPPPRQQYSTLPEAVQSQPAAPPQGIQQMSPPATPLQSQEQQRNFNPYVIPPKNNLGPSSTTTPSPQHPQYTNPYNPPHQVPQPNYTPSTSNPVHYTPPTQPTSPHYPQQQAPTFAQPPPQQRQQYQQTGYLNPAQPSRRTSMLGGSMLTKVSSKFTQMQQKTPPPPSSSPHSRAPYANPNTSTTSGKPTDWKKWGKRAAMGVAAVGALTLGVDAMDGGIFDGAAGGDLSGGGDFSGGDDFTGGGGDVDAQTAVDANAAQLAMEQQGQENALMLLDPVGTEYTMVETAI